MSTTPPLADPSTPEAPAAPPRRRGRPPGSKDRKPHKRPVAAKGRKLGRPKGSKNKKPAKGRRQRPVRHWCVVCRQLATRTATDEYGVQLRLCDSCPDPDQIKERAAAIRPTWVGDAAHVSESGKHGKQAH